MSYLTEVLRSYVDPLAAWFTSQRGNLTRLRAGGFTELPANFADNPREWAAYYLGKLDEHWDAQIAMCKLQRAAFLDSGPSADAMDNWTCPAFEGDVPGTFGGVFGAPEGVAQTANWWYVVYYRPEFATLQQVTPVLTPEISGQGLSRDEFNEYVADNPDVFSSVSDNTLRAVGVREDVIRARPPSGDRNGNGDKPPGSGEPPGNEPVLPMLEPPGTVAASSTSGVWWLAGVAAFMWWRRRGGRR